jgi:hypothetical protein
MIKMGGLSSREYGEVRVAFMQDFRIFIHPYNADKEVIFGVKCHEPRQGKGLRAFWGVVPDTTLCGTRYHTPLHKNEAFMQENV